MKTVRRFVDELPAGSLGHEYAKYVIARSLDNAFLEWMEIDEPGKFLVFRMAHLHDLLHFVLGYEAWDPIGEMEIEAFLVAQSGALNHWLFLLGFVMNLTNTGRSRVLASGLSRLRAAFALGKRAENLLLVRWEDLLASPLAEVKASLGIADRPESRASFSPRETPKLAHVVLNVKDRLATERFYQNVFGYRIVGRDEALGVTFLTAGDDHHTVALHELPPANLISAIVFAPKLLARAKRLFGDRYFGVRSREGRRAVFPPLSIIRAALRPGLQHLGFRATDESDLCAYKRMLEVNGVHIVWAVNHGDVIKGIYFFDVGGNLCEIFCDSSEVSARLREMRASGVPFDPARAKPSDFRSYDLVLEADR